jgi:hypothetical protein
MANIYTQWAGWTAKHKGLSLPEVQAVIDDVWPPPRTGGLWDDVDFSGGVFSGGGPPIAPPLTDQQEKDLGTAAVLVERGYFATIAEALQSIREDENPEVPVPEAPPAPPAPPQEIYVQPSRRGGFTASDRIATPLALPRGTPQPSRRTPTAPYRGALPLPRGN